MRRSILLAAMLGLGGCESLPSLGALGTREAQPPVTQMALADGMVRVATPLGYCIDEKASRPGRGFVIFAGCALVSNEPRMPGTDGLITVQIGDAGTASVDDDPSELRNLLASAQGAALLSTNGDPTSITVDALEAGSGAVYVHFRDSAEPPADGLERTEWRAFFDLGDRLATVTLRGFERAPIESDDGLRLLRVAVDTIRQATATAERSSEA